MTNQEAIEFLKNMIDRESIGFVAPSGEGDVAIWQYHVEALQMAIKALELATNLQPCNQDCISRQAAIDAILAVTGNTSVRELYEHVQEHGLSDMWSGGVNAAIDVIIAVPPAQPEIVRCKDCEESYEYQDSLYCSAFRTKWNKDYDMSVNKTDFCSRAEMKTNE